MPRDESNKPSPLDPAVILALLTVVGGLFLVAHKLNSDRPILQAEQFEDELSEQRFDSRLWQDPFAGTANALATNLSCDAPGDLKRRSDNHNSIQILLIMVPVDPSTENKEVRTRMRYAVVSGLTEAGWLPERPENIGIWQVTNWPAYFGHTNRYQNCYVPFEWYSRTNSSATFVAWLDEDSFYEKPYERLQLLLTNLCSGIACDKIEKIVTIGPFYSSTLKDLIANAQTNKPSVYSPKSELIIAVPRANDEVLINTNSLTRPNDPSRGNTVNLLTNNRAFSNVVSVAATDSVLAEGAINALRDRGVDLNDPKSRLVLITDQDTFASQTLEQTYDSKVHHIHAYHYLKGLDGQDLMRQTNFGPGQLSGTDSSRASGFGTWRFDVNRAEGPNQLDYLGRLATTIPRLQGEIVSKEDAKVKAICIGGGDVYDTLLILQALRPSFPDAIFFSTDLDARLWDPKEWEWTHNMLVFSGYGLRLDDKFQSHTAPFRDSRQTAVYTATLKALNYSNLDFSSPTNSRQFEIARSGPLDLSANTASGLQPRSEMNSDHPWNLGLLVSIIVLLLAVFWLALLLSPYVRTFTLERQNYLAEPLFLREEDIGGYRGLWHLENALRLNNAEEQKSQQSFPLIAKIFPPTLEETKDLLEKISFHPEDILKPEEIASLLTASRKDVLYKSLAFQWNKQISTALLARDLAAKFNRLLDPLPKDANAPEKKKVDLVKVCYEDPIKAEHLLSPNTWELLISTIPSQSTESSQLTSPSQLRVLRRLILQDLFSGMLKPLPLATLLQENVHNLLYKANDILVNLANEPAACHEPNGEISAVDSPRLTRLIEKRREFDKELCALLNRYKSHRSPRDNPSKDELENDRPQRLAVPFAAEHARQSSWQLHCIRKSRLRLYQILILPLFGLGFIRALYWIASRMKIENAGIFSASSPAPTIFVCCFALILAVAFMCESRFQLEAASIYAMRLFRLPFADNKSPRDPSKDAEYWPLLKNWGRIITRASLPCIPPALGYVTADKMWFQYNQKSAIRYRVFRTVRQIVLYLGGFTALLYYLGQSPLWEPNLPAYWLRCTYLAVIWFLLGAFLFLTFWTVDAACLCRWFIQELTQGPTKYSMATIKYFRDLRPSIDDYALAEYIDVKIIAEITERVGAMLYFPAIILSLMLLAHNTFTYVWPWRPAWVAVMICHFIVALLSMVILQRAAKRARDASVHSLEVKLQQIRAAMAATQRERAIAGLDEGEKLLEEMRTLRAGAFVGLAGNPVVGALLVPSGGTVLIELIRYFIAK